MRKLEFSFLTVLFVCALSMCPAFAAGTAATAEETATTGAPEGGARIIARISVKSAAALLSRLDGFVAAATAGRRNELPAGTLTALATLSLPLSLDSFDASAPVQIVFLTGEGENARTDWLASLSAPDFAVFIENLGEAIPLTRGPNLPMFLSTYTWRGMTVAEAPGGRVYLYSTLDLARKFPFDSMLSTYDGDDLISAAIPLHADTIAGAADILRERLDLEQDDVLEGLRSLHINESAAAGILSLLQDYVPGLVSEAAALGNIRVAVDLDAEKLTVRAVARPRPESLPGRIAAGLEAAGNLDLTEMRRLPASAMSVGVVRVVNDLLPAEDTQRVVDTVFTRALPALRDDALALLARSRVVFAGTATAAIFTTDDGRRLDFSQRNAPDPVAALAVVTDGIELTNRAVEALIDDPAYRVRFVGAPAEGLDGFTVWRFEFADPATMRRAFEDIDGGEMYFSAYDKLSIYAGLHGGALSVLSGVAVTPEDVKNVLARLDAGGPALAHGLRARDALDWLTGAEGALFLINADSMMQTVFRQMAAMTDGSDKGLFEAFLEEMPPRPGSGEAMGFAAGADDGELEFRGYVPVQAVNAFMRDWEAFDAANSRMQREAAKQARREVERMRREAAEREGAGGDDEEYDAAEPEPEDEDYPDDEDWEDEEDDVWEDEDGEAIILDAPADAS